MPPLSMFLEISIRVKLTNCWQTKRGGENPPRHLFPRDRVNLKCLFAGFLLIRGFGSLSGCRCSRAYIASSRPCRDSASPCRRVTRRCGRRCSVCSRNRFLFLLTPSKGKSKSNNAGCQPKYESFIQPDHLPSFFKKTRESSSRPLFWFGHRLF